MTPEQARELLGIVGELAAHVGALRRWRSGTADDLCAFCGAWGDSHADGCLVVRVAILGDALADAASERRERMMG